MQVNVYLPNHPNVSDVIARGSAIVGKEVPGINDDVLLSLYYEGNLFGQFKSYEECILHAADRLEQHYPTIARMHVLPGEVTEIGTYDTKTKELTIRPEFEAPLADWTQGLFHAHH